MTPLRQRMLDALQLRGRAERTIESYLDAVSQLARHYGCSPERLSAEQVQAYLLHLLRDRHLARSSLNQYGCAFRFLYGKVLGRDGAAFQIPLAPAPQKLPEILSRQEVARILAAAPSDKARVFLSLAYATGLRLSELCQLQVGDIHSHSDRMCIRVQQGKGAKDRYVPLKPDVLALLRGWWRRARPPMLLFAAAGTPQRPPCVQGPQRWYRRACTDAGVTKRGGIHSLRHAYATHELEAGTNLYDLQHWLGHSHISTTMRYLHLARPGALGDERAAALSLLGALPPLPAPH